MDAFQIIFSEYINRLGCTSKELSLSCDLSPVVISRYRSGDRTPLKNSPQFGTLVHGLYLLCQKKGLPDTEADIENALLSALPHYDTKIPPALFRERLVKMVQVTHIPMSHMARALSYDPSYLSKICSGLRFPSAPMVFLDKLCQFVARHYETEKEQKALALSLGFDYEPSVHPSFADALISWFNS